MTGRGGRGDRVPPPQYPLPNGGDFVHHHQLNRPPYQPPPPPVPYLHRDPAFQSNGHDPHFPHHPPRRHSPPVEPNNYFHHPPWRHSPPVAPHNYFHHQAYPQNPNPNYSSPSPYFRSEFNRNQHHRYHNPQFNHQYLADDIQRQSFLGYNHRPSFVHQHEQSVQDGNSYRSVASTPQFYKEREIDERYRRLNGLEINSPNFFRNPSVNRQAFQNQEIGRKSSGGSEVRQPPPASNPSKNRRRKFEQNVDKEKTKIGKLSRRVSNSKNEEEGGEKRVMLEHKKPRGDMMVQQRLAESSNLHLVSAPDSEQCVLELHSEVGKDDTRGELDMQPLGSLVLEIGFDEKKATKPRGSSRGKGRRSDARGKKLLPPKVRKSKRQAGCRSDIHRLNAPFLAIYESLMPPEEEKVKKKQLLTLLEKLITKEWPEARMYVFGSCANSFAVLKSDIDVCLTIENPNVNKSEALMKLADMLQSDNFQNVQALTHARIPIVKLMEPVTGISCDISMNNVLAVENTKLLRDYAQIDVRLRQLALIVKHWAKSRGINETYRGTLSSYAYVLMCIHFLQQRKPAILPCLQEMERTYAVMVENVECSYFHEVEKLSGFGSSNMESIAQLVWGFFNYWAYWHDYSNNVISVRTGSIFRKHDKNWTRKSGNERHLLSIEDPFEISHDLGRAVDGHSLRVLKEEFERAAIILQNEPDPCVNLFEPYVPDPS